MTEQRAAYEAAQNEAMHTGDYAAPDLEYTPAAVPLRMMELQRQGRVQYVVHLHTGTVTHARTHIHYGGGHVTDEEQP